MSALSAELNTNRPHVLRTNTVRTYHITILIFVHVLVAISTSRFVGQEDWISYRSTRLRPVRQLNAERKSSLAHAIFWAVLDLNDNAFEISLHRRYCKQAARPRVHLLFDRRWVHKKFFPHPITPADRSTPQREATQDRTDDFHYE